MTEKRKNGRLNYRKFIDYIRKTFEVTFVKIELQTL